MHNTSCIAFTMSFPISSRRPEGRLLKNVLPVLYSPASASEESRAYPVPGSVRRQMDPPAAVYLPAAVHLPRRSCLLFPAAGVRTLPMASVWKTAAALRCLCPMQVLCHSCFLNRTNSGSPCLQSVLPPSSARRQSVPVLPAAVPWPVCRSA